MRSSFKVNVYIFRGRLESNAEQWLHLVNTLQELISWLMTKQQELHKQRPIGGDTGILLQQNGENKVQLY